MTVKEVGSSPALTSSIRHILGLLAGYAGVTFTEEQFGTLAGAISAGVSVLALVAWSYLERKRTPGA
jgi:hypothetical protein